MSDEHDKDDRRRNLRSVPQSDIDFNLRVTDTVWGGTEIPEELKEKLEKHFMVLKPDGSKWVRKEGLWQLLGFYTRDMRLANLSTFNGEITYCQYYLDLANDFLRADFVEPFLISLSRVATILELSQSKGGFLRKRMGTRTEESYHHELEPKKKNFFGMSGGQKEEGG